MTKHSHLNVVALPQDVDPTPKEQVLGFLDTLRAEIADGIRPVTDLIVIAIEETEFTDMTYALSTPRLSRIEIIGNLHAVATDITTEHV